MCDNSRFNVRLANSEDINQLVDLQIEYEKHFMNLGCDAYNISRDERQNLLMEFVFSDSAPLKIILIEDNNKILAYCTFYRLYIHEVPPVVVFYVTSLYIKKERRNSNLLFLLFKYLVNLAKKQNVKKIISSVWGGNKLAFSIYKRVGVKFCAAEDDEHFWYLNIDDFQKSPLFSKLK